MKLYDKKGSHVDMVLSFTLFVVAMVFIYLVVTSAFPKEEPIKNALTNLKGTIKNTLTKDVWVLRYHEGPSSATCFAFTKPESIPGAQTVAINDTGSVASSISGNDILIENTNSTTKIYYSPFLENQDDFSGSGCVAVTADSVRKEKNVLESQILSLMSNFTNNYSSLKTQLSVPSGRDFDLYFKYSNGTTLGPDSNYPNSEIYSTQLNLFFLSKNSSNDKGTLRIRIWQ